MVLSFSTVEDITSLLFRISLPLKKKGAYMQRVPVHSIAFGNFTVILLLSHPLSLIKLRIEAKICLDLRLWMGPFFIGHCSRTQILAQKCFFVLHMAEMVFFNRDHGKWPKNGNFHVSFQYSLYSKDFFVWDLSF